MLSSWRAGKVAVRFRPEERRGLLKSLGPDRLRFNGLGLAVVERDWHVCWLRPDELEGLSHRLRGMQEPPFTTSPLATSSLTAERLKAADSQFAEEKRAPASEAGLTLVALVLCREGETFPLPWQLAREAGFKRTGQDPCCEEAGIAHKLFGLLSPHADQPLPKLSWLTPRKFARLASADWFADGSAFHLRLDLPSSLLQGIAALDRARLMLEAIAAREPLPADSLGRLPMGLVLSLLESPAGWPGTKWPGVWSAKGIPTEDEVPSVRLTRALLQGAGLLGQKPGGFCLTLLGRSLLERDRLGELYARLFESRLRKGAGFEPAVGDVCLRFHRAMAYHLYRLALCPGHEMPAGRLAQWLALPAWVYGLQPRAAAAGLAKLVSERFLKPLMEFGLLAIPQPLSGRSTNGQEESYVPTPLLPRFLGFDV
jgi:hypothetical protein